MMVYTTLLEFYFNNTKGSMDKIFGINSSEMLMECIWFLRALFEQKTSFQKI